MQFSTLYVRALPAGSLVRVGVVLMAAVMLQGCASSWPFRARAVAPVEGKDVARLPLVTPTTRKATATVAPADSLHSDVPVLLTVPEVKVVRSAVPLAPLPPKPEAPTAVVPLPKVSPPVVPGASGGNPPLGSILPPGMFGKPSAQPAATLDVTLPAASLTLPAASPPVPSAGVVEVTAIAGATGVEFVTKAKQPLVLLFASPTTRSYLAALGIDYQDGIAVWEDFLRRQDVRFEIVNGLDGLKTSFPDVLLLPSAVALTDSEKRLIADFRERGGSVLSSWLTGVRGESGQWLGFGFMEQTLNTKVVGNTEGTMEDTYVMPHGDNPVLHHLPAGLRIWVERAREWYALRLSGAHSAAEVMDWSRTVQVGKPSSVITFDERVLAGGKTSRSVVLGYPERLWASADRAAMETIARDALNWLARQPDAYAAAWPWPFRSALVLAVDAPDELTDGVLRYAKLAEELGGGASYFVLAEEAESSATVIKDLQSRGHEIAYLGDQFFAFKGQSVDTQAQRLDTMVEAVKAAGIEVGPTPGFRAPMESYDAVTEGLLSERGFSYEVGDPGSAPARLPVIVAGTKSTNILVNLPRTQSGPDDAPTLGDPAAALRDFADEFTLGQQMAGLSVVRFPGQSTLNDAQWVEVSRHMKANSPATWTATAGRVAAWWRERERVRVTLDTEVFPPLLTVSVSGDDPLRQPVTVLVNLPQVGSLLSLVGDAEETGTPRVVAVDRWRHALILEGLAPGAHHWFLSFDRAPSVPK